MDHNFGIIVGYFVNLAPVHWCRDGSMLACVDECADSVGSVFISYSHSYKSAVLRVRDRLKLAGFTVWIDEDEVCMLRSLLSSALLRGSHVCFSVAYSQTNQINQLLCRTPVTFLYCRSVYNHQTDALIFVYE